VQTSGVLLAGSCGGGGRDDSFDIADMKRRLRASVPIKHVEQVLLDAVHGA
jgi:hypothetical protein